ncbi:dihydropteroate synthase [Leucobacter salsicius]|uniref:dihydropteroate synthase n=1 Tax=Leucobacter salsicius TaxID=664638 RepID=UPI00034A6AEE|nr:dihydropteroate synthase [Leucobacter salsicius]
MSGASIEVMGVLNVTPDSFSDGGKYVDVETAVRRGEELMTQGASFVDVGGESTRPGSEPVSEDEEAARVLPVIRALVARGIPVSIDTIHASTAEAAANAGAGFINDVSGGTHDPRMCDVAAAASKAHGTKFIIGHWRGIPDLGHHRSDYTDVVTEVRDALTALAAQAIRAGVDPAHVVIDPGLGFDKTDAQCWQLLTRLPDLAATGYPVLVGASRKRMLGEMLGGLPGAVTAHIDACETHERDLATSVVSAFAARAGAWGVRVHDVAGTTQALAVEAAWSAASQPTTGSGLPAASTAEVGNGDRITLTGLEVFAHHGVFDFEREQGQKFLIDAEISVNLHAAAAGDALGQTVHYGELADAIVDAVKRDPVDLIETVAERVAAVALGFPSVREARITVSKPDAPIEHPFENVSVTVVR